LAYGRFLHQFKTKVPAKFEVARKDEMSDVNEWFEMVIDRKDRDSVGRKEVFQ
jgi:hypothetical protein